MPYGSVHFSQRFGRRLLLTWWLELTLSQIFLDVIQLAQQDRLRFALFAWTISLIWMCRNKLRAEEETFPLAKISSLSSDGLQEYQQLRPIHTKIPRTRSVRWRPPPTGLLKVNFDGAYFAEDNKAGLGIIIRNNVGLVMAAMTQQIPLPASVEMVEVLAAR